MSTKEAESSIKGLLSQVDQKSEIIPYDNFEKFVRLLEFIKGSVLKNEEKNFAKELSEA